MIVKGEMKVSVHDVYGWERVAEAHKEMEANKNSGKVSRLLRRRLRIAGGLMVSQDRFGDQVNAYGKRVVNDVMNECIKRNADAEQNIWDPDVQGSATWPSFDAWSGKLARIIRIPFLASCGSVFVRSFGTISSAQPTVQRCGKKNDTTEKCWAAARMAKSLWISHDHERE